MMDDAEIDILNEPIETMAEERLRLFVKLLRRRVAWYEGENAKLAAENDRLNSREEVATR